MDTLVRGAQALGLKLTTEQTDAFQAYYDELVAWNRRFNLTAVTEYEQVQVRHFLDSLSCLLADEARRVCNRAGARAIDVGSGAGFPGIPLKLVCPSLQIVLLEATGKKVSFLERIVALLSLDGVTPLRGRAEETAHDPGHRARYDLALARAVAELPVLVEYVLPFCKIGGWMIAQKGTAAAAEAQKADHALSLLGGEIHSILPVKILGLAEEHYLVVIRKTGPTPDAYPRRPGIPAKRPLSG